MLERDPTLDAPAAAPATDPSAPRPHAHAHEQPTPGVDFRVLAALIATVVTPAALTLATVNAPRPMIAVEPERSPYGYTVSLLNFVVPVVVLLAWFLRHPKYKLHRKSFYRSIGILTSLGVILDLVFGTAFFTFPNRGAVIGIWVPAIGGSVPLEEFGFYSLGFAAILLTYIWSNEYWLGAYAPDKHTERAIEKRGIVQFHPASLVVGVALFALALGYKKLAPGVDHAGFPGYFTFLLVVGIVPSMLFLPTVRDMINWRALSFTVVLMLLVSLLWEASLAVPYQWWGYKDAQMIGIRVDAWSNLPVEEPILWTMITYAGVIYYEVIRIVFARRHAAAAAAGAAAGPRSSG